MNILLKDYFVLSIAAPRGSGKSYLGIRLLKNGLIQKYDQIHILCPSLDVNEDYDQFRGNSKFKFNSHPNSKYLDELFDTCYQTTLKVKKHNSKQDSLIYATKKREKLTCPNILVILDDCIDSGVLSFKGGLDKFAERGRHIKASLIIMSQRISAISRSVRINSNLFLIFCPFSMSELEQFIDQFTFREKRKQLHAEIMEIFEKPYTFIIVDNTAKNVKERLLYTNCDMFINNQFEHMKTPLLPSDDVIPKKRKTPLKNNQ